MPVTISGTAGVQGNLQGNVVGNLTGQASELAPGGINNRTLITDLSSNDMFLFWDSTDQTLKKVKWENLQPPGSVLRTVYAEDATYQTATGLMPADINSGPLVTEGEEIITATIRLSSASNKVLVKCNVPYATINVAGNVSYAVFRGSTCIQYTSKTQYAAANSSDGPVYLEVLDEPGVITDVTYSLRVGPDGVGSRIVRLNGDTQLRYGGISKITMTLQEIKG